MDPERWKGVGDHLVYCVWFYPFPVNPERSRI